MEMIVPGTPEQIYNLMFASGFIKDFLAKDQKLIGTFVLLYLSALWLRSFQTFKRLIGNPPRKTNIYCLETCHTSSRCPADLDLSKQSVN